MVSVISVQVLKDFQVLLEFNTAERKTVDLEPFLRGPIFESIRNDRAQFEGVRVDEELGTIAWANGADIDPDVRYGKHRPAWMETATPALTPAP